MQGLGHGYGCGCPCELGSYPRTALFSFATVSDEQLDRELRTSAREDGVYAAQVSAAALCITESCLLPRLPGRARDSSEVCRVPYDAWSRLKKTWPSQRLQALIGSLKRGNATRSSSQNLVQDSLASPTPAAAASPGNLSPQRLCSLTWLGALAASTTRSRASWSVPRPRPSLHVSDRLAQR